MSTEVARRVEGRRTAPLALRKEAPHVPPSLPGPSFVPLDPSERTRLDNQAALLILQQPDLAALRARLLAAGGQAVSFGGTEPDLAVLLARGVFSPGPARLWPLDPGQCHRNAALLWRDHRAWLRIATGYAFGASGVWVSHSWLVESGERGSGLIETTTLRLGYFGAILTEGEAAVFALLQS
jgi:hypothetical protein